jgi:hypothetical protein
MGSVYGERTKERFYSKEELINFFKTKRFENSYIGATNLSFDFFGLLMNTKEIMEFTFVMRGSDLIFAKTYIKNKEFNKRYSNGSRALYFLDTLNYVKASVDDLGKILGIPKLKESVATIIGKRPTTPEQWERLRVYNMRDAEISQKVIKFFFESFNKLGANPKKTIASTSMSLFKNRFLKKTYYTHSKESLLHQFEAYYGGNTHAYSRGLIENYKYYDFNSLYPSVMCNIYPDPNTKCETRKNTLRYIEDYEGISKVDLSVEYLKYPLLPYRADMKLIFPYGSFTGSYSHVELRKAIELGYTIKKVHHTTYFKENIYPFIDFVKELYELRKNYKRNDNPMELVVKLLMNSLYGKFGQKFINRDNWLPFNHTKEELDKLDYFERIGQFIRIKKESETPAAFCFPIWALYTTAYARLKLHDYILKSEPVYVDTDSLITKKELPTGDGLGELKLETNITKGLIVKPKFYSIAGDFKDANRIKGIGIKLTPKMFYEFITNPKITYKKFMKFKESIRRNLMVNEIVDITKEMSLEDDKRLWEEKFDASSLQESKALEIIEGVTETRYESDLQKAKEKYEKEQEKLLDANSELFEERFADTFDSMGDDITKEEFLKNETNWRDFE